MSETRVDSLDLGLDLIEQGVKIKLRLTGTSMRPFLQHNDFGFLEKPNTKKLRIGDIIVIRSEKNFIVHRLVKLYYINNNPIIETRGDACFINDPPSTISNIIAIINSIERNGKHIHLNTFKYRLIGYLIAKYYIFNKIFNRLLKR